MPRHRKSSWPTRNEPEQTVSPTIPKPFHGSFIHGNHKITKEHS